MKIHPCYVTSNPSARYKLVYMEFAETKNKLCTEKYTKNQDNLIYVPIPNLMRLA